jgi:glucose-1-phosphate cytidylyltransferase
MHYSSFGYNEFVIALGYKGEEIINWMHENFALSENNSETRTVNEVTFGGKNTWDHKHWQVHLVNTGPETLTGGRIKRLAHWIGSHRFMLTWCDAVSDVNLNSLLEFHQSHGCLATLTAVQPPPRFGHLKLDGDRVVEFKEKSKGLEGWINGAFFVLEPKVFDYIEGDNTQFEREPLERLARDSQLMAYRHAGFWQCMDTIHEREVLEEMLSSGKSPWVSWKTSR